jgi:DNA mismatch endonuclease (patch repair protein)
MRQVRRRDTTAELIVRRWLWNRGIRFTTHNRDLPGSPDLANRSKKWGVFVHGCFWHGHEGCKKATIPKRNTDFWKQKITGNRLRDARKEEALRQLGYKVIVIWECDAERLHKCSEGSMRLVSLLPLLPRSEV